MFLLRLFRFVTGFVCFEGRNGFPERFLNLCSLNGINVWDAKSVAGTFSAKTNISCYKKIRPCANRSGMKLKVTKKCGLPFILKPYIKRKGLITGAAISFILICILSSCIWTVSVIGNEKFTQKQITEIAQAYGIKTGVFRNTVNPKAVRERIKADIDAINWFSVNIDRTSVSLEVLENSGSNEILDLTTPCNIVSSVDGELISLEVYTGEAALSVGNAVTKGDLLISGVIERNDGSAEFIHARGNALVRTKKEIAQSVTFKTPCKKLTDSYNRYTLSLFSLQIPLTARPDGSIIRTHEAMLEYNSVTLPAGIITETHSELYDTEITLNQSQAILLCSYNLFCKEREIMLNATSESQQINTVFSEKGVTLHKTYINHVSSGIEYYFQVNNE